MTNFVTVKLPASQISSPDEMVQDQTPSRCGGKCSLIWGRISNETPEIVGFFYWKWISWGITILNLYCFYVKQQYNSENSCVISCLTSSMVFFATAVSLHSCLKLKKPCKVPSQHKPFSPILPFGLPALLPGPCICGVHSSFHLCYFTWAFSVWNIHPSPPPNLHARLLYPPYSICFWL